MKKTITLAKHAGFCYGVKRAVETTKKLKIENPIRPVCVLGELIHNSDVISELDNIGISTVEKITDLNCRSKDCGVCVIRSHGLAQTEINKISEKGYEIVDLTCIDVKKVQQKAVELAKDNALVVIVGKSEHPEVMAIYANAKDVSDDVFVVSSVDEVDEALKNQIKSAKYVGVVSQTTQKVKNLQSIVSELLLYTKDLRVFNTICPSTTKRQTEACELARKSDLMVVVGSKKSANTTHLAELLTQITETIHIENEKELDNYIDVVGKSSKIGITAGASTPQNIIEAVINKLENHNS